MNQLLSKEESYIKRRELFKNIWDTAVKMNTKDPEITSKSKRIRTVRLDEVDHCVTGKKAKQRLQNLRHVCNKILVFCDRQDTDALNCEELRNQNKESLSHQTYATTKSKYRKHRRMKRKTRNLYHSNKNNPLETASDQNKEILERIVTFNQNQSKSTNEESDSETKKEAKEKPVELHIALKSKWKHFSLPGPKPRILKEVLHMNKILITYIV